MGQRQPSTIDAGPFLKSSLSFFVLFLFLFLFSFVLFVHVVSVVLYLTGPTLYASSFTEGANRPAGSAAPAGIAAERKYLIGGNWKCNGTYGENKERVTMFNGAGPIPANVEVVLCCPDIHLPLLASSLRKDIAVGGQNCGVGAGFGAYTGETSSLHLTDLGCTWVIIGHSERRDGFGMAGETVELCAAKTKTAIDNGLSVMFVSLDLRLDVVTTSRS